MSSAKKVESIHLEPIPPWTKKTTVLVKKTIIASGYEYTSIFEYNYYIQIQKFDNNNTEKTIKFKACTEHK